jgi:hypothetical protein
MEISRWRAPPGIRNHAFWPRQGPRIPFFHLTIPAALRDAREYVADPVAHATG